MYYVLSIMYYGKKKTGRTILFLILVAYYILHTTYYAYAVTLSNDNFIIETNGINLQPKASSVITPQPESKDSPTLEQKQKPFSFSLSSTLVDFGEITPTDPTTRALTIHISPGDISRFSLFALLDHELESENKKIIPNTTCDNGSCDSTYASSWDNILTYGFGWQCKSVYGFNCQGRFPQNSDFMQLPNQAKGDTLYPILFGDAKSTKAEASITYKANVSTTQDIGLYTNILQIVAVPDF